MEGFRFIFWPLPMSPGFLELGFRVFFHVSVVFPGVDGGPAV